LIPRPPSSPLFPYTTLFRSTVFQLCRDILRDADITFANLESTYSTRGTRTPNIRGMMRAHPRNLAALNDAGFEVMNFANNHHMRSEEHTSELQSRENLVCRL